MHQFTSDYGNIDRLVSAVEALASRDVIVASKRKRNSKTNSEKI